MIALKNKTDHFLYLQVGPPQKIVCTRRRSCNERSFKPRILKNESSSLEFFKMANKNLLVKELLKNITVILFARRLAISPVSTANMFTSSLAISVKCLITHSPETKLDMVSAPIGVTTATTSSNQGVIVRPSDLRQKRSPCNFLGQPCLNANKPSKKAEIKKYHHEHINHLIVADLMLSRISSESLMIDAIMAPYSVGCISTEPNTPNSEVTFTMVATNVAMTKRVVDSMVTLVSPQKLCLCDAVTRGCSDNYASFERYKSTLALHWYTIKPANVYTINQLLYKYCTVQASLGSSI